VNCLQRSLLETTTAKESFVGCVLFYVGGFSLLRGVGMMFMLHQFVF
jgi:hypothetical protein